jgi:hypothetical protein
MFSQNVGIGTTNPQSKLHILSANDDMLRLDANQPYISFYSNGVFKAYFWKGPSGIEIGSASGSGLPLVFAPDGNQRMFVTSSGNVGIQNSNPNAPLAFPAFLGKKITLYPGASGDVGFAVQGNLLEIYADHPNADVAFGYDQSGVFTERMRVRGNGNVGIGTNNPLEKLEVNGNIKASSYKFPAVRTYYYSVPPSAFRQVASQDVIVVNFTGVGFNLTPTPASGLIAPVLVPHGAIITGMTAWYSDVAAGTDIRIDLQDHVHGTSGGGLLASVISSGTPGEGSGTDNTISSGIVNNQLLDYSIIVSSTIGPWPGFNLVIRSVLITYTLSEVY